MQQELIHATRVVHLIAVLFFPSTVRIECRQGLTAEHATRDVNFACEYLVQRGRKQTRVSNAHSVPFPKKLKASHSNSGSLLLTSPSLSVTASLFSHLRSFFPFKNLARWYRHRVSNARSQVPKLDVSMAFTFRKVAKACTSSRLQSSVKKGGEVYVHDSTRHMQEPPSPTTKSINSSPEKLSTAVLIRRSLQLGSDFE